MYSVLLALHSIFRWLVLLTLLTSIFIAFTGMSGKRAFTRRDNTLRILTSTSAHIQLLLGIALYFISPLIQSFMSNFKELVKVRQVRFFGMEHSVVMLVSIVLITIGSAASKRKPTDAQKFKTQAIWYTIALVLLISSIPWPFSPMVGRPWLRGF